MGGPIFNFIFLFLEKELWMEELRDVQKETPEYQYDINQVGIRNARLPVNVLTKEGTIIPSVATFNLYVSLDKSQRGTHMSRFLQIIQDKVGTTVINYEFIKNLLQRISEEIGGNSFVRVDFPYFIQKTTPVTNLKNIIPTDVTLKGSLINGGYEFTFKVKHIVMSLCPCSKEISRYNAHNQRALVSVAITPKDPTKIIWFEDIINIIETCSSGPVFSILKRMDEKFVTEYSYDNPKFCEDIVRCIAHVINERYKNEYKKVVIESEHLESIHPHNAFARLKLIGEGL